MVGEAFCKWLQDYFRCSCNSLIINAQLVRLSTLLRSSFYDKNFLVRELHPAKVIDMVVSFTP